MKERVRGKEQCGRKSERKTAVKKRVFPESIQCINSFLKMKYNVSYLQVGAKLGIRAGRATEY